MITHDREYLKQKCRELDLKNADEIKLVQATIVCLEKDLSGSSIPGVGLSAIQIGIPVRLSVIRIPKKGEKQGNSFNLINPVIIEKEDAMVFRGEGCLSFPNIYKDTRRFNQITIENYNLSGSKETLVFEGFEAVAVQHEIDHMDGIVFLDRLQQPLVAGNRIGRNDPCPCGSGKKFKKCCAV